MIRRNMYVNRCCSFRRQEYDQERSQKRFGNLKDLTIEIQYMWNVKTKVTPVTTGATGTIPYHSNST
jgi:hypothetical protein